MNQKSMSDANRNAWTHRTGEALVKVYGTPADFAEKILTDPKGHLWRTIDFLGDVKGKRIINLLGSSGRKAVPLALLGAEVTIVDISEQNMQYAVALAECAGVKIDYIIADVASFDITELKESFDIVLMELGIMHYFIDLKPLASLIYELLKPGGRYVLNEGHPIKKCIKMDSVDEPYLEGDYFDTSIVESTFAYSFALEGYEESNPPKVKMRRWTLGEIITVIAEANLTIKNLSESPGSLPHLPGHFTLLAIK
jgi:SAM-dependent methyltransferase